jgi:glycine betaine/choline ABC-type transport system substrate-binding protein
MTIRIGRRTFVENLAIAQYLSDELTDLEPVEFVEVLDRTELIVGLGTAVIDLAAEYVAGLAGALGSSAVTSSSPKAVLELERRLAPLGVAVAGYTQWRPVPALVMRAARAEELRIRSLADLQTTANTLAAGGPEADAQTMWSALGFDHGASFRSYVALDTSGPLCADALAKGEVDVILTYSTDPRIAISGNQIFAANDSQAPADNIAVLVRSSVSNNQLVGRIRAALARLTSDALVRRSATYVFG